MPWKKVDPLSFEGLTVDLSALWGYLRVRACCAPRARGIANSPGLRGNLLSKLLASRSACALADGVPLSGASCILAGFLKETPL